MILACFLVLTSCSESDDFEEGEEAFLGTNQFTQEELATLNRRLNLDAAPFNYSRMELPEHYTTNEATDSDNTPEENPINLEDSSPSEETPLERQLRLIEAAEESVEQTLGRIDRLEKAFANLQPHLDKKQFEMADAAIYQVMTPLCKEMADHIHRRHSRMIDQFQTLNSQTDLTKPHEWYPHARLDRRKVRRMVPIGSFQPN